MPQSSEQVISDPNMVPWRLNEAVDLMVNIDNTETRVFIIFKNSLRIQGGALGGKYWMWPRPGFSRK